MKVPRNKRGWSLEGVETVISVTEHRSGEEEWWGPHPRSIRDKCSESTEGLDLDRKREVVHQMTSSSVVSPTETFGGNINCLQFDTLLST